MHRINHRDIQPLESMRDKIIEEMKRDGRYAEPEKTGFERLKKRYNTLVYTADINGIKSEIAKKGEFDSLMCVALVSRPVVVAEINKKKNHDCRPFRAGLPQPSMIADERLFGIYRHISCKMRLKNVL